MRRVRLRPALRPLRAPRGLGVLPLLLASVLAASAGRAAEPSGAGPVTELRQRWPEKQHNLVLDAVTAGRVANLHEQPADPSAPNGVPPARRRLSSTFLADVLAFAGASASARGVYIIGAEFDEHVDLSEVQLKRPLRLEGSRFGAGLSLARAKIEDGLLSLAGSTVVGHADLNGIKVGRDLIIGGDAPVVFHGGVALLGADVGGSLDARGSTFRGALDMGGTRVGGRLLLGDGGTVFGDLSLVGARIDGDVEAIKAVFGGVFNMDGATVAKILRLSSRFTLAERSGEEAGVNTTLRDAKVGRTVNLCGSSFAGELDMRNIETGNDLLLSCATFEGDVRLEGAKVGGNLLLEDGSTLARGRRLDMGGIEVGESLRVRPGQMFGGEIRLVEAEVGDVVTIGNVAQRTTFVGPINLISAKIGSTLELLPSNFWGVVELGGVEVGDTLYMRGGSTFSEDVWLVEAQVGDGLRIGDRDRPARTTFRRKLDARRAVVGQNLELLNSTFEYAGPGDGTGRINVTIRDAKIGGTLEASGSTFHGLVDLTGTEVGQLFAWPAAPEFELHGLTYKRLPQPTLGQLPWMDWLSRDQSFTPQPYQQFAAISRQMGDDRQADAALYESRDHEFGQATPLGMVGLFFLKIFIGYGLGVSLFFLPLVWMLIFTLLGALVLWTRRDKPFAWCWWASLDEVLPLVELNEEYTKHVDALPAGGRRAYFHAHRVVGYVLGSFVIAGLAGITQGR